MRINIAVIASQARLSGLAGGFSSFLRGFSSLAGISPGIGGFFEGASRISFQAARRAPHANRSRRPLLEIDNRGVGISLHWDRPSVLGGQGSLSTPPQDL